MPRDFLPPNRSAFPVCVQESGSGPFFAPAGARSALLPASPTLTSVEGEVVAQDGCRGGRSSSRNVTGTSRVSLGPVHGHSDSTGAAHKGAPAILADAVRFTTGRSCPDANSGHWAAQLPIPVHRDRDGGGSHGERPGPWETSRRTGPGGWEAHLFSEASQVLTVERPFPCRGFSSLSSLPSLNARLAMTRRAYDKLDCRNLWGLLSASIEPGLLYHDPLAQDGDRCGCFDPDRSLSGRELAPGEARPESCSMPITLWTGRAEVTTCCTCYGVLVRAAGSPARVIDLIDSALSFFEEPRSAPAEARALEAPTETLAWPGSARRGELTASRTSRPDRARHRVRAPFSQSGADPDLPGAA